MVKVQVVVTDANILINLIHIGRLSILGSLPQFEFVVPDEVVAGERLQADGPKAGMLLDFGDISAAVKPLLDNFLDHHHLNETTGLRNPTSEAIARWIYERLQPFLPVSAVHID